MNIFPRAKQGYCDNELAFKSVTIKTLLLNNYGVSVINGSPLHSTSDGQVERFYITLLEIARCLKLQRDIVDTVNLILHATVEYNNSVYSMVGKRPRKILHAESLECTLAVSNRIQKTQRGQNARENRNRQHRVFEVGEKVLLKASRRLGNKLSPLRSEEKVEANLG